MNMKKTIAAIAAGAVAVSAVATSVSALESKTLSYNLVETLNNQEDGKVTLKATFPNVPLVAGTPVKIEVPGMGWKDTVIIGGQYIDTNKVINPITVTRNIWAEGYSLATESLLDGGNTITIPVREVNDGSPALIGGVAEAAVATDAATVSNSNLDKADGDVEALVVAAASAIPGPATTTFTYNETTLKAKIGTAADSVTVLTYTAATNSWDKNPADYGIDVTGVNGDDKITITYTAAKAATPVTPKFDVAWFKLNNIPAGTYTAKYDGAADWKIGDKVVTDYVDVNGAAGLTVASKFDVTYVPAGEATGAVLANITVTVNMSALTDKDITTVNEKVKAGTYGIKFNGVYGDAKTSAFTKPSKYKSPLASTINSKTNILAYLETAKVNGEDKSYNNVGAVINDAIENFDEVTFTFNTAASTVAFGIYDETTDKVVGKESTLEAASKKCGANQSVIGLYVENSWEGTDEYKAFGQHLYEWFYAPEKTEFTGYDWTGTNLFAGALVINEGYTMSLSDTQKFDWTKTGLSFSWDAIESEAMTSNSYAKYIHSMKLLTSTPWFWDSMDVVLVAGEAEDAGAGEGEEVGDDTLDENGGEEIGADEGEGEEAPETTEPEAPETTEPEIPEVENEKTGNASVALAVIPVALAAAAVVAKKRS